MQDDYSESLGRLKESFLFAAAQGGLVQDCSSLLEFGVDINWKGPGGDTPLLSACRRGHIDTVSLLLAHGASANIAGTDFMSPLHIAAKRGDHAMLNLLLDCNADLTSKTSEGLTAADIARSKGFEDIYGLLLSRSGGGQGSRLNLRRVDPSRPLPVIVSPRIDNSDRPSNSSKHNAPSTSIQLPSDKSRNEKPLEAIKMDDLASKSKGNYTLLSSSTLISQSNATKAAPSLTSFDENVVVLQNMLGQEQREKKILENKLNILKEQVLYLTSELSTVKTELESKAAERSQLVGALDLLKGSAAALANLTLPQCEQLESQLRNSLEAVEQRKATLIQLEMEAQKEQRLCVVCQERDKCVVLLPCRHMCMCEECSSHKLLDHCPLCRRPIAHKISVFS